MKRVLPRLAEFGEDDEREADGLGTPAGGSQPRSQGHKRCSNRPQAAPHRGTQAPITASPSTINLCCTTALRPPGVPQVDHGRKMDSGATVSDSEELRQLHQLCEYQKHARVRPAADLTLTGQATALVKKQPTLLTLADTGTPTDGNTQWTAVSLGLTHSSEDSGALACLLLCKRVPKELPRVNIADWKSGTVGIPTFHCHRCCRHWFRRGNLPMDCKELEDITEGPAMCFTIADKNSGNSEIIVQGILGEDGKPVRVKVKDVSQLQKMMKRKKMRRMRRKRRVGRRYGEGKSSTDICDTDAHKERDYKSSNCYEASTKDDSTSTSSFLDTSDSDGIPNLPKSVQQYLMRKSELSKRRKKTSKEKTSTGDNEVSSFISLSDFEFPELDNESVIDNEHKGNQRQSKRKKRCRNLKKVQTEQSSSTSEDRVSGSSSSEVSCNVSEDCERQVSLKSKGKHKRRGGCLGKTFQGHTKNIIAYLPRIESGTDEESQANSSNTLQGEQGTPTSGRGSAGPAVHPTEAGYSWRERCLNSGDSFHLPNIADTSSPRGHGHHVRRGSVATGSTSPTLGDSTHLPQLCNKNSSVMQQHGSLERQIEAYSRRESTVHSRRQSTSVHSRGLTSGKTPNIPANNRQQNLLDGHKLSKMNGDAMRRVGGGRRRSSVAQWTMNPQTTADFEDPSSASGVDRMHHSSATQASDIATKTATIKEDVYLPKKMPNRGSKRVKGNQKKEKLGAAETPHIEAQMLPEKSTGASRPVTTDQGSTQTNLHTSTNIDETPRRYGRKIVKKTRKEADRRQPINHNSKDLGNLVGHREQENDPNTAHTGDSSRATTAGHRESLIQEEASLTSTTEQHGRSLRSAYREIAAGGLVPPLQEALNKSSAADTRQLPGSVTPQPVEGESSRGGLEELTSGLGAKFTPNVSAQHQGRFSTPVQLKPLTNPPGMFPPEIHTSTGGPDQKSEISPAKENMMGIEYNSIKSAERVASSSTSHDSGLRVLTEEDTGVESDDEESTLPLLELEPISPLSFTSPYSYSLFPMAPQYQEAYERVRKRALQPLRIVKRKLRQPKKR